MADKMMAVTSRSSASAGSAGSAICFFFTLVAPSHRDEAGQVAPPDENAGKQLLPDEPDRLESLFAVFASIHFRSQRLAIGLEAAIYCSYIKSVRITFDPAKRAATIEHRGLDFADATKMFDSRHVAAPDDRRDYGEQRFITAGYLAGRIMVIVWTPRDGTRRVMSLRYAHDKEVERWQRTMDRPG